MSILWQKSVKLEAGCSRGRMQQLDMNAGWRYLDDMPAAGVMRMSADDDDQADQQHELADPGMVETDHSVLETAGPQFNHNV